MNNQQPCVGTLLRDESLYRLLPSAEGTFSGQSKRNTNLQVETRVRLVFEMDAGTVSVGYGTYGEEKQPAVQHKR